jgi:hypothetical protein
VNPFTGETVIMEVAVLLARTVRVVWVTDTVKSGWLLTVIVRVAV